MAKFSENVINSKVFPVSRELPKEINEKLERYKKMMMASKKKEEPKEEAKEEAKEETKVQEEKQENK